LPHPHFIVDTHILKAEFLMVLDADIDTKGMKN